MYSRGVYLAWYTLGRGERGGGREEGEGVMEGRDGMWRRERDIRRRISCSILY